ncbi:imidazolonepropionase-like amidohydrolase [Curtobacterium luteum]|uniref:Amidohydrolase n=1 Tax=Curtobacterium luteum TaxID=33881 RepID=A0A8H9L2H6_9MICO|nr:amidohydrolase [Curtobacterium luteum]MBM7800986.1 imidazolonepropionase-like amidohydrolase [Curtobacterium luteum]NUU50954.1 amidohydrolase [Curtobacterium luteum]GGL06292.1 amidohydrolase [Curtobacterium luteum]
MTNSFAITGAHVVPVTSPEFDGGTVVVEDGRITAIGPEVTPPPGLPVVDAAGAWLVPGFVEAHGHVGIHEEANGEAGNDTNEMTGPNMAGVRAIDAVDIQDEGFRDALAGGVTSIVVKPGSGNPIGGQTVAIKTWGGRTIDEQLISDSVSVKSALGENPKRVYGGKGQTPSTRLGVAKIIRDAFVEAQNYRAARDAAEAKGDPFARDLTKETLVRVLDGELAWDQHTHRHDDIATAIRLAEEFGYRLVVNHGTEAHKIADVLAEKAIPVIYGPLFTSRSKVELRDRGIPNLATIAAAGVRVAITTDAPVVPINMLVDQATAAVKEGLPWQTALEALTTNPADILGFGDRVGRLEPGYDADLVLWDGDPLAATSRATRVWIEGAQVFEWVDGQGVTSDRW